MSPQTLSPVSLSPNAKRVLESRYLKKDIQGRIVETPEEMFWRVALNVAQADYPDDPKADVEATATIFYKLMSSLTFLPNSPTLMNAGRDFQQLHACFVLPVEDSLESIFEAIKQTALIQQSGGGTGFSFSHLRPKGSPVKTTSGTASGPVSFLKVFDAATQAIKQGSFRRGANMGILRVDHPDILEFIRLKRDSATLTNFNISVAVTDEFMKVVEKGGDYPLVDPVSGKVKATLQARELFKEICQSAWACGDPGLIFLDRINEDNPTPDLGMMESTNPCGELPLLPYEACVLGSINLSVLVREVKGGPEVDWERLKEVVHRAVHFLDNVVDATHYPIRQIEAITKANRKIGLGVMGLAHLLARLGLPYDSAEAVALGEKLMQTVAEDAVAASEELAKRRGAFPNFKRSIFHQGPERRNATLTTVAPTGTLSIIANTTSGIEPIFAIAYIREVLEGQKLVEFDPYFEQIAKAKGFWSDQLVKRVTERGTVRNDPAVAPEIQRLFVAAHEIAAADHLTMQAAFQKHTENAISKTINMSQEATPQDVEEIYKQAWKLQCKGITIYRDRSRPSQVLSRAE